MNTLLSAMQERADRMVAYARLRTEHPEVPAKRVVEYLKHSDGESFAEFCCPGHRWSYTGIAYGGEDESYHGEGRCYCLHCGKDGDS